MHQNVYASFEDISSDRNFHSPLHFHFFSVRNFDLGQKYLVLSFFSVREISMSRFEPPNPEFDDITMYQPSNLVNLYQGGRAAWLPMPLNYIMAFVERHQIHIGYNHDMILDEVNRLRAVNHNPPMFQLQHVMRTPVYMQISTLFSTLSDGQRYISDYRQNEFHDFGEERPEFELVWLQDFVRHMLDVPRPYDFMVANPDCLDHVMPGILEAPRHLQPLQDEDESDDELVEERQIEIPLFDLEQHLDIPMVENNESDGDTVPYPASDEEELSQ